MIQAYHHYAGGAVGDQADQCGHEGLQNAQPAQKGSKGVLPYRFNDKADHKAEQQNKAKDLGCVVQRRPHDAALLLVFLVAVHLVGTAAEAAAQAGGQQLEHHKIQQQAKQQRKQNFYRDQAHHLGPQRRLGDQKRNGFV